MKFYSSILKLLLIMILSVANLNSKQIDVFNNNIFLFNYDILEATQEIKITLDTSVSGYVAWGISPDGKMANSDCMFAYISNGKGVAKDLTCNNHNVIEDSQQDLTQITGSSNNGRNVISYVRKLNTGDSADTVIKQDAQYTLIFSYSNSSTSYVHHDAHNVLSSVVLYPKPTTSTTTSTNTNTSNNNSTNAASVSTSSSNGSQRIVSNLNLFLLMIISTILIIL